MAETPDAVTNPVEDDAEAGGTPEPDTQNAEADPNREKLLHTLQEKASRVNAAEERAKRLEAQVEALTRVQSPAARGSDPQAERRATIQRFADGTMVDPETGKPLGPDPLAQEVIELRNALSMTVQELANVRELDRVTDEDKRSKITKHFNDNRHRLGDVKAARAEIEAEERAAKNSELEAENEKLRKALEAQAKRPGSDTVQTHAREVSAAEHKEIMTQAQWNERQAQLERQADAGDLEASRLRRKEQVERANGKLRVEG